MAEDVQTLYGRKACLALFHQRPQAIRRIFYRRDGAEQLAEMFRWAAANKRVYREVPEEELAKVAKSSHHEGLVVVADSLRFQPFDPQQAAQTSQRAGWMALDRVENPHNLGAILRSAAFFGLQGVLLGGLEPGDKVNAAAIRVAQGGAEHLTLCAQPVLPPLLHTLKGAGWQVMGLETGGRPLGEALPAPQPWMLVAGHEADGLAPETQEACSGLYTIPGAATVESLNVSVAVGVALGALGGHLSGSSHDPSSEKLQGVPPQQ